MSQPKAVILLSGGLDSATIVAMAKAQGFACYTMSFDYGQRHRAELQAAERVARQLGVVEHKVIGLDLNGIGGSALTDPDIAVPETPGEGIPVTYVPARNTVFLSLALGWAEVLGARHLFIGVNAVDYSGYPDCRPEFVEAFERLANLATKAGVEGDTFKIEARPGRHRPGCGLRADRVLLSGQQRRGGLRPLRQLPPACRRLQGSRNFRPHPLPVKKFYLGC